MKAVRISLLTVVLLVSATSRPVPPASNTLPGDAQTLARAGDGPCYFINGAWVCP